MQLKSARELKQEILARIVPSAYETIRAEGGFSVTTFSVNKLTGVEPTVAVGIIQGKKAGDVRLALRIQRHSFEQTKSFITDVSKLAKNEIDIRYVGRIARGQAPTPWYRTKLRPLEAGSSVGHFRVTAGTLGAFANRRRDGELVMLSNNHVLANENNARRGDAILQPGRYDGGRRPRDVAGRLADWVPLKSGTPNHVDAAIAALAEGVDALVGSYRDIGTLAGVRNEPLLPGQEVVKIGRTTGLTHGRVTATEVDGLAIEYDVGTVIFDDQIEIEGLGNGPFSSGGDSGSLILDDKRRAACLLFAGSERGGTNGRGLTYANPIGRVLDTLAIDLALA
ncbi:hypothetical protein [Bosea sp. 117]|uniref:hypothetical protein n=1 Tax=Bosea sp. 117 TaxID=1125973 RepID=UPI00057118AE|nr:hypothetical protein [Bosea sp. 117]